VQNSAVLRLVLFIGDAAVQLYQRAHVHSTRRHSS